MRAQQPGELPSIRWRYHTKQNAAAERLGNYSHCRGLINVSAVTVDSGNMAKTCRNPPDPVFEKDLLMPKDFAHLQTFALRAGEQGIEAKWPGANFPTLADLMVHNGALVRQNRQLTVTLARLTAQPTSPMACLTPRQKQVMALVLAGRSSKIIADDLNISQRTVENHRAAIMRRTGATSLPSLVRLSMGVQ